MLFGDLLRRFPSLALIVDSRTVGEGMLSRGL